MKVFHKIIAVVLLSLFVAACSKKETPKPVKTNMDLMLAHPWKITDYAENGVDKFSSYDDCIKDDVYHYNTAGVLLVDNGASHCSASEGNTTTYFWSLSADEKAVNITINGQIITYQITKLTDDVLEFTIANGNTTETYTFLAQ